MTPSTKDQTDRVDSPVTRVSGNPSVPKEYTELDYVEQEKDLMNVAHGPWVDWETALPKDEGPHQTVGNSHPPTDTRRVHVQRNETHNGRDG